MEKNTYTFAEIIEVLEVGQEAVNEDSWLIKKIDDGSIVYVGQDEDFPYEEPLVLSSYVINSEWTIIEEEDDSLEKIDEKAKELYDLIREYVYKDGGSSERAREVMELMIKYQTFMC